MNQNDGRLLTAKTLGLRLVLALAVLFGACSFAVYRFSVFIVDSINNDERDALLTSIESGPLQLARLNSAALANTYLTRLTEQAHIQNPSIIGAKISSGVRGEDTFAEWAVATSPKEGCQAEVQRETRFDDGIYPYVVKLIVNECATRSSLRQIQTLCIVFGIVLVFMTMLASSLAALPIFQSLRAVEALVDKQADPLKEAIDLAKIRYRPLRDLAEKVLENRLLAQQAAVARMTEMLAHDVRKPFSILRMGLIMLGNAKDPAGVKAVLSRLTPEIDKAVSSVDGLIADVMEVGSTSTELIQEPVSPESLIDASLGEIFRIYPKAMIGFTHDFRHSRMVNVHAQKLNRVFSNIIGNAVQAMNQKGVIWFKTREGDGYVEFCIGNSGSLIPEESLPKLFDAFFTSGKEGGTGLGLAIAQKVVVAHGGKIWCESSKTAEHPDGKVEFYFTLPIATKVVARSPVNFPRHSSEIAATFLALTAAGGASEGGIDSGELALEAELIKLSAGRGRPIRVLAVDDEQVYRDALASYLDRTPELRQAIGLVQAVNSDEAIKVANGGTIDLIIFDVDMGQDSLNGFELVRELRMRQAKGVVCIHSNRIVAADHRAAIDAGADAFVPKPMGRAQMLRLLLQAASAEAVAPIPAADKVPEVLVIDDNTFVLDAWQDALAADANVHAMENLEDLKTKLEQVPGFLQAMSLVITDMHLAGSAYDGIDVGQFVKREAPGLRVLLSSDGIFSAESMAGAVDLVIGKSPVRLAQLQAAFN